MWNWVWNIPLLLFWMESKASFLKMYFSSLYAMHNASNFNLHNKTDHTTHFFSSPTPWKILWLHSIETDCPGPTIWNHICVWNCTSVTCFKKATCIILEGMPHKDCRLLCLWHHWKSHFFWQFFFSMGMGDIPGSSNIVHILCCVAVLLSILFVHMELMICLVCRNRRKSQNYLYHMRLRPTFGCQHMLRLPQGNAFVHTVWDPWIHLEYFLYRKQMEHPLGTWNLGLVPWLMIYLMAAISVFITKEPTENIVIFFDPPYHYPALTWKLNCFGDFGGITELAP